MAKKKSTRSGTAKRVRAFGADPERIRKMAGTIFGTLNRATSDLEPVSVEAVNLIELHMREAVTAMTTGIGKIEHASCLSAEVSKAMVLCESGFAGSKEYLPLTLQARDALKAVGERAKRVGRWGLSGPELQVLLDFIELRVAQLNESTKGVERAAYETVVREIESGNVIRILDVREGVAA